MPESFHFLLLPGFSALGFMSALEPLRVANRFRPNLYAWHVLSLDGAPVAASNGLPIAAQAAYAEIERTQHIFVVAGFDPLEHYTRELGAWLRLQQRQDAWVGGIDTGAFVLAEAGVLSNTDRLTVHWEALTAFRERYPRLNATQELFEIEARRITCAGGTASIDMMLDLIRRDHGAALATAISEQFVVGRIRERSTSQRLEIAARYGVHNRKLVQVIDTMQQCTENPLAPEALAETVGVTVRQLERLFSSLLNDTPARFYLNLRLDRARELLRQTDMSVTAVCVASGFESPSHFSRVYRVRFGISPRGDRRTPHAARPAPAPAGH
jgi:AraC family transcriptional regulator, carnitine catabolism transcriptional activator